MKKLISKRDRIGGAVMTKLRKPPILTLNSSNERIFPILVFLSLIVDGNWSAWSAWSTCSKSCKQGEQSRTRECNSPKPQYGGKKCEGSAREKTVCNKDVPCPGNEV